MGKSLPLPQWRDKSNNEFLFHMMKLKSPYDLNRCISQRPTKAFLSPQTRKGSQNIWLESDQLTYLLSLWLESDQLNIFAESKVDELKPKMNGTNL